MVGSTDLTKTSMFASFIFNHNAYLSTADISSSQPRSVSDLLTVWSLDVTISCEYDMVSRGQTLALPGHCDVHTVVHTVHTVWTMHPMLVAVLIGFSSHGLAGNCAQAVT